MWEKREKRPFMKQSQSSGWVGGLHTRLVQNPRFRNHAGSFSYINNAREKAQPLAEQTTPPATCHLPVCKCPPLLPATSNTASFKEPACSDETCLRTEISAFDPNSFARRARGHGHNAAAYIRTMNLPFHQLSPMLCSLTAGKA